MSGYYLGLKNSIYIRASNKEIKDTLSSAYKLEMNEWIHISKEALNADFKHIHSKYNLNYIISSIILFIFLITLYRTIFFFNNLQVLNTASLFAFFAVFLRNYLVVQYEKLVTLRYIILQIIVTGLSGLYIIIMNNILTEWSTTGVVTEQSAILYKLIHIATIIYGILISAYILWEYFHNKQIGMMCVFLQVLVMQISNWNIYEILKNTASPESTAPKIVLNDSFLSYILGSGLIIAWSCWSYYEYQKIKH